MEKKLLRVNEVADTLGICRSYVYRLIAEGTIESVNLVGGRCRRVPAAALDAFIEKQRADHGSLSATP